MREILFRGKHQIGANYGKWVEGQLNILKDGTYSISCYETEMEEIKCDSISVMHQENVLKRYSVVPETIGQFTGIYDCDGNRIFEGDIILFGSMKMAVMFDEKSARYLLKQIRKKNEILFEIKTFDTVPQCALKVIGNICDNFNPVEMEV